MIHEKLLKFKALNVTIEKDGVNPHFKNRYSTLNEVLSKVQKPLADMKVLVIQSPRIDGLETILRDTEDDTEISSLVPYTGVPDMQKLGGAITYARRYALISMLGLEDEDDDGTTTVKPILSLKKGIQEQTDAPFNGNDFKL